MSFYKIITAIFRGFSRLFFKYEIIGAENIPNDGKIVIAANHKSNLDPIFIAAAIRNRTVAAVAKKELFDVGILGYILRKLNVISINRDKPDISTIKDILNAIKDGYALGIFPEGTRVKGNQFGDAKAGLSLFAIKGKADIIPVSIVSDYKLFKRVTIYIDKPISFEEHYKSRLSNDDYEKLSKSVMEVIIKNYHSYSN